MMDIACTNCGRGYPEIGIPYRCPRCGGLFDDREPVRWKGVDDRAQGIWRFAPSIGIEQVSVTLCEGRTPLVPAEVLGKVVYFKCEYANPTGSFKDRGSASLVSFLVSRGVSAAVEDSSGNAGASFAAYAARSGLRPTVYVPASAAGLKRTQIASYGARVVPVAGPRSEASAAARAAAEGGATYASHAYLPQNIRGYATCALEIWEDLGQAPGSVILPAGQGGLLLGLGHGFEALLKARGIDRLPVLVGVQAAACAPLFALFEMGVPGLGLVTEGETVAEGVRVRTPLRASSVLEVVSRSAGHFVAVAEARILPGRDSLARLGFYVEPTSALVWAALEDTLSELPEPVVVVLTGSGYKVGD
jgi:threonine synthase